MAVENTFSVTVGGISYTSHAVFPPKLANLLDERLDEGYISLRHIRQRHIAPATRVDLTIHNKVAQRSNTLYSKDKTFHFIVANDNAVESPVGSNLWNHDIYVIELTKYLEMIVVESLCFTNSLGKNYLSGALRLSPSNHSNNIGTTNTPDSYTSPQLSNSIFTVQNMETVLDASKNYLDSLGTALGDFNAYIRISRNGVLQNEISNSEYGTGIVVQAPVITFLPGTWTIDYYISYNVNYGTGAVDNFLATDTYTFSVVSNQYPLKRITCTDVINRLLDLAEPLMQGETPRFKLNAEQAELFDKIYAPQLSMTRQTLRECLQEVGKIVHGEPRLTINDNNEYEIIYDLYGGTKQSAIGKYMNIYKASTYQIEQFCSSIDSSAQNMVNQTDWAAGVIVEPDNYYYKTVRTEQQYVRITDANMIIATDRPIYQLAKEGGLKVLVPNGRYVTGVDLTPYVVESTIYNSQLSSYSEEFPYSKAYGIYFTQGEKDIKGLNFKNDDAVDPSVFSNYAIVNIIQRACDAAGISWTPPTDDDYAELLFQVTYIPYFDVRVAQSKPYYKEFNGSYALIYNQSANTIESRYYGENLKGVVARLGNPELVITYNLSRLDQLPTAGEMYDDDYYISAVTTEFYPTYIKCMVALSRDFNRLSQFVGISSEKRYYEVSERQTYDRSTLYHEYIVIGDEEPADSLLIKEDFMDAVADTFTQTGSYRPLTRVVAWGGTYDNPTSVVVNGTETSPLSIVQLPVVSVALGNSMCFAWNYADNYSAGPVSQYESIGEVSGYWQTDYQYTDYYGRMYYYNFDIFMPANTSVNAAYDLMVREGMELPEGDYPTTRSTYLSTTVPYVYRKDSREIPQYNVQIEYITNRKDLIIGSALASSCGLIRGTDSTLAAKLYVLDSPINKFTTVLNATPEFAGKTLPEAVDITITKSTDNRFYITSGSFPNAGKSWVILTNQTTTSETVEDETGEVTTQTMYKGGELLLACNGDFSEGDDIGNIWFTPRRNPYGEARFLVIFSDDYVEEAAASPEEVPVYTQTFSDTRYTIPATEPTETPIYTQTFSDTDYLQPVPTPTEVDTNF